MTTLAREVRIDETRRELEGLAEEIRRWSSERTVLDTLNQYTTQLAHVSDTLEHALTALRRDLPEAALARSTAEVAASCRSIDDELMLVRRVWTYFSTKWSQRDDCRYRAVLAAADEIVWSCYADPMRAVGPRRDGGVDAPAPLPYIESAATPAAIARELPPEDLRAESGSVIEECVRKLAVPVVSLPSRCALDPWWLVLLAHEVGHHLQYDLCDEWGLITDFADVLRDAVDSPNAAAEWARWGREVFADACSVCTVGGAAVSAVATLELDDDAVLLSRSKPGYPPPAVRVALLAEIARSLGVAYAGIAGEIDARALTEGPALTVNGRDLRAEAKNDLKRVPAVAQRVLGTRIESLRGPLAGLFGWSAGDGAAGKTFRATLASWRRGLLGLESLVAQPRSEVPRQVIGAAFSAWGQIGRIEDAGRREEGRGALAERLLKVLPDCREDITRAAETTKLPEPQALGEQLAAALRQTIRTAGAT